MEQELEREKHGSAPAWHAGGCGFESRQVHHNSATAKLGSVADKEEQRKPTGEFDRRTEFDIPVYLKCVHDQYDMTMVLFLYAQARPS